MKTEEWERKLKKLKEQNPTHDLIPVIEDMGCTFLSAEYLQLALEDEVVVTREEYTADSLFKKRDSLYSKRAQLSNKFHTCTSDSERLDVSVAIGSIQTEIMNNRSMIEKYLESGKLPKLEQLNTIPLDGRAQERKLRSIRSSISRFLGLIRSETDPDKLKSYRDSLATLQTQRDELSA